MTDRAALVAASRALGADVAAIQGGGGNTSLKCGGAMAIKASGRTLADIDDAGFVEVDWRALVVGLPDCADEADYAALLARCAAAGARPSIEIGFHALLGTCVLHSHAVWANLLTCAEEGAGQVAMLFPHAQWVDYATPGLALTRRIAATIAGRRPEVLFLQNHGLIVVGAEPSEALARHNAVVAKIRAAFAQVPDFTADAAGAADGLLFPDQAVFHADPTLAATRAGAETLAAARWLARAVPAAGLTLRHLPSAEAARLTGMEAEKHRQRMAR